MAVLADNQLDRVSFGAGFKQVCGKSDFAIYQKEGKLILRHFDVTHPGPASLRLEDTAFDDVQTAEAPTQEVPGAALTAGDLYVFRCYDARHYAKMAVIELLDGAEAVESARQKLKAESTRTGF